MPFRVDETRTTIHIITFAEMPSLIYDACDLAGTPSNTRYIQEAICEKLARDLDVDYHDLIERLPATRARNGFRAHRLHGPGNTVEDVR